LLFDEEFEFELLLEFEDEFELEFDDELELLFELELELELLLEFEFEFELLLELEFELLLEFEFELLFEFELPFDDLPSLWLPWWRKRNSVSPPSSSFWKSWKKRWIGSPEGCPLCAFAAAAVEVISEATRIRFTSFIRPLLFWGVGPVRRQGPVVRQYRGGVFRPNLVGVGGFGVSRTIRRSSHLAINSGSWT
jgi:hypothetical protein